MSEPSEATLVAPYPTAPGARPDELALWDALLDGEWPRDAGARLGIPPRRVEYLCLKWSRKRIYDYGVVYDMGWPEPQSLRRIKQARASGTAGDERV